MKRSCKIFIGVLTFILGLSNCGHKTECRGFVTNEFSMDWYFATAMNENISFTDINSTVYEFTLTEFNQSESRTVKCRMFSKCACDASYLTSIYQNNNLYISLIM
jgi:hypothetical protein